MQIFTACLVRITFSENVLSVAMEVGGQVWLVGGSRYYLVLDVCVLLSTILRWLGVNIK